MPSPTTLILDCASNTPWAGVVTKGAATVQPLPEKKDEAALLPAITALLSQATGAEAPLQAVERIVAVTGPGGFMSLRVGIAMANALSWSLKIPLAGVHMADLWAARCKGKDVLWLHATKREALFVKGCGALANLWPAPSLIGVEELGRQLASQERSYIPFVGEVLPEQREKLPLLTPHEQVIDLPAVLPTLVEHCTYSTTPLEPWYGRHG